MNTIKRNIVSASLVLASMFFVGTAFSDCGPDEKGCGDGWSFLIKPTSSTNHAANVCFEKYKHYYS